ncbi:hypothetical protein BDV36DRAFT_290241 [Aspergillus pseudocaelatus]|uniref:Uncharacterized protein n=1 Tax=Aspergillus pseudocaelatus TaxID=1825620 RepID=A0ABQ6X2K1_9EURO|nr:hypothetical protein BDV36DRAFT_290241 [Aspergillus pseudocaelatus]
MQEEMYPTISLPESFDELPDKRQFWPAKPGSHDEGVGMLRILSPSVVANAAKTEIQTGERLCLNWDLKKSDAPGSGRRGFEHHIRWTKPGHSFDDESYFNPQQSSQWEGFRHHNAPDGNWRSILSTVER